MQPLLVLGSVLLVIWLLPGGEKSGPHTPCKALSGDGSTVGMTLSRCRTIASDTASEEDPLPFWGRVDCASESRQQWVPTGGDIQLTAAGSLQGDTAFRRLTIFDADEAEEHAGRCELGYNWNEDSDPGTGITGPGPTVFYEEGQRRVTFASLRIPAVWNVDDPNWRTVLQMKQAEPYNNDAHASMFELQVRDGNWLVINDWHDVWTAPATPGVWTRFAFDLTYSQDPRIGSIKVYVDLNDDGDFNDSGEQSPTVHRQTLLDETAGEQDAVPPGGSVPSHLRAGLYQNEIYSCPPPDGCYMDIDNVQVVEP